MTMWTRAAVLRAVGELLSVAKVELAAPAGVGGMVSRGIVNGAAG